MERRHNIVEDASAKALGHRAEWCVKGTLVTKQTKRQWMIQTESMSSSLKSREESMNLHWKRGESESRKKKGKGKGEGNKNAGSAGI